MKYIVLIICLCNLFSFTVKAKERPTVITAEIFGYQRDKVHFDFIEKEGINMEFPYKDGQLIEFMVELDDFEYVYRGLSSTGGFYSCKGDL